MEFDFHTLLQIFGVVSAPLAGWAFGVSRSRKKQMADKDSEIDRLRVARDKAIDEENLREHTQLKNFYEQLRTAIDRMVKDLYDQRIEISQQYATMVALRQTEERFFKGQQRLEDKMDRVLAERS